MHRRRDPVGKELGGVSAARARSGGHDLAAGRVAAGSGTSSLPRRSSFVVVSALALAVAIISAPGAITPTLPLLLFLSRR